MSNTTDVDADVIIFDTRIAPTEEQRSSARAKYADYTVRIRRSHSLRPAYARVLQSGNTYRFGGAVMIAPYIKMFEISVRPEATQADLWFLEGVVADVREGHESQMPFRAVDSSTYPGKQFMRLHPGRRIIPGEAQYGHLGDYFLVDCDDSGCRDFGGFHDSDVLEDFSVEHIHDQFKTENLEVRVNRYSRETDWRVELFTDDDCRLTPTNLASHISDLQWALAEAKKLNAA